MFIRTDWISFSVPVEPTGSDDERKTAAAAARAIRELSTFVAKRLTFLESGNRATVAHLTAPRFITKALARRCLFILA